MSKSAQIATISRIALATGCALALTACQRDAASEAQADNTDIFTADSQVGRFSLQAMSEDDMADHELEGNFGCTFTADRIGDPLLVARGFEDAPDSTAQILVKYGNAVLPGIASETGGYDGMLQEATFDTGGILIDVAVTSDERAGRGSLAPYPAMMRTTQPIHGEEFYEGYWACGPVSQYSSDG